MSNENHECEGLKEYEVNITIDRYIKGWRLGVILSYDDDYFPIKFCPFCGVKLDV